MKPDDVFVLGNAGWPALLVNYAATILRANQSAVKMFGPALEGEAPLLGSIWAPENGLTAEQFIAQWERSPVSSVSLKFRIKGGGTSAFLISICSFSRDSQKFFVFQLFPESTTKSAAGESSLIQKQKLDCALQLARTVSLDFNNALTSILGHTSLLLSQMPVDNPWRSSLIEVEKSAAKAAEIANDLAAFSRQEKEPRVQAAGNLNSILQRSMELFQNNTKGTGIDWKCQLERKLFAVKFDEAKMQQVFVKVFENAVEATESNGRITAQTRNIELAEAAQDRELRLAAGTYVCVEISDNGKGIAPDVLPRIFEPFFTTKKGATHRGLGLALVYGIVTNHGGGVAVSSQPDAGTSVRIYLPAERKIVWDNTANSKDLTGSETILMVDDEDLLLTMGQTVLSAYGYRVLTANSGQKAVEILSRKDASIDLLITDLVMPAMSGRELVEQVRQLSPDTRILCTSGFMRSPHDREESAYLQKPFTSQELLIKVKGVLTPGPAT